MNIKIYLYRILIAGGVMLVVTGCGTIDTVAGMTNSALEVVGIKKPEIPEIPKIPDVQKPPRTIQIDLHASNNLNVGTNGQALALIARIYKLKQNAAFEQASYEIFLNPQKEKELLGADLIEVKEVTLVPGQRYHADEKVSQEAYFIGVVGLFRDPAIQRWRVTFPAAEAEKSGIVLGMHACAINVGTGLTSNAATQNTWSLSTAKCP
ncbi:MAG: type VI secretion system lipoprotein TssJ [Undibacterium sp.]|uniref:type VI secretion system lipoprotein TssJ n=1 Tax=Undibacterium sp. TaxID=1914977 RepID=UPI00271656D6|nr:type VI secretion system lipoprotein TssJ [Undibacterium sp.]MDO8652940.1 type VI secretion system lipoprotein TssJ [Undibacterium sp.]